MNRRRVAVVGAGVGLASVGLGWALRWFTERQPQVPKEAMLDTLTMRP